MRVRKIAVFLFLYCLTGLIFWYFFLSSGLSGLIDKDREQLFRSTFGMERKFVIILASLINTVLLWIIYSLISRIKEVIKRPFLFVGIVYLLLSVLVLIFSGDNLGHNLVILLIFVSPHMSWLYEAIFGFVFFTGLVNYLGATMYHPVYTTVYAYIVFFLNSFIIVLFYKGVFYILQKLKSD